MNKPTLKYAATEALAMLEEAIELFGSGEKGDQIVVNLRFALAEESAEIDALKAENDKITERNHGLWLKCQDALVEVMRLRKDAERYRFLRRENSLLAGEGYGFCVTQEDRDESGKVLDDCWIGTELDMVLDAAMSALPDTKGE